MIENVILITDEKEDNSIPQLLQENDILEKMEDGTNSNDSKKSKFDLLSTLKTFTHNDDENNYHSEDENLISLTENIKLKELSVFKKLDYKEVEYKIDKAYFDINHKYSSALDILASYLKGQKIIYMESKFYCESHLNCYMMPAILFSTIATVLSSFINKYNWL